MKGRNLLTNTPYLVLFIVLGAITIGTASALVTITLAGDVVITGNTSIQNNLDVLGNSTVQNNLDVGVNATVQNNLDVGGEITGSTIANFNTDIIKLQKKFFKDIIVTNNAGNNVSILLGNGYGIYSAQPDVSAGLEPISVAVGDLNNDGIQDVVVVNQGDNDVSILLGNNDGTFTRTDVPVGTAPFSVDIGDLDNDGIQDVVVVNAGDSNVSILLGNGDGTFSAQPDVSVGADPFSLAIGDLDNDGIQDVVVVNSSDEDISILIGNGDGTFTRTDVQVGSTPMSVAIGDFGNSLLPNIYQKSVTGIRTFTGDLTTYSVWEAKCNSGDQIISGGYTAPIPNPVSSQLVLPVAENLIGIDTYQVHLSILLYAQSGSGSVVFLSAPAPTLTVNCFDLPP